MKKNFTDKRTGISYTLQGDYYLPDLALPAEEQQPIGVWGTATLTVYQAAQKGVIYQPADKR